MTVFRFKCRTCDEWHEGVPHFGADAPLYYYSVPDAERASRCDLGSDDCVIDEEFFFIRGCIEIPVEGLDDNFGWGVWASLSKASFDEYMSRFEDPTRALLGPYFGWLSAALPGYPDTENLKVSVQPLDPGLRPLFRLEPTDHPLAIEQSEGITQQRLIEIVEGLLH